MVFSGAVDTEHGELMVGDFFAEGRVDRKMVGVGVGVGVNYTGSVGRLQEDGSKRIYSNTWNFLIFAKDEPPQAPFSL